MGHKKRKGDLTVSFVGWVHYAVCNRTEYQKLISMHFNINYLCNGNYTYYSINGIANVETRHAENEERRVMYDTNLLDSFLSGLG